MKDEDEKIVAKFMGLIYIPKAKYKNDLYVMGDLAGEWETTDIYVLNPSDEFLDKLIFGAFADEDHYDEIKPYDEYDWSRDDANKWGQLMPVVEKIEITYLDEQLYTNQVIIFANTCSIDPSNWASPDPHQLVKTYAETKLEATYKAVVEFIKWYGKNKGR